MMNYFQNQNMIGQLLDSRYRIVQIIGSGAFGQTYLAADTRRPGHPECVVKQLRPPANNKETLHNSLRLFEQEAKILEKLGRHERIPLLLAYFEDHEQFYLVEEFIPGNPLSQEIIPGQEWSEEQVIDLLIEILEILLFVHDQGVIHRDVNPANLIRRKTDGKIIIIDFGSVKEVTNLVLNANGEAPRTIATGTPSYMPIEQFQGHPQYNSDIYSVGMIGVQALTGLPATELPKVQDMNFASANHDISSGNIAWRQIAICSKGLAEIIDRMIHYHHTKRYQSSIEVLRDLKALKQYHNSPIKTVLPKSARQVKTLFNPVASVLEKKSSTVKPTQPLNWRLMIMAGLATLGILIILLQNWWWRQPDPARAESLYKKGITKVTEGDTKGAIADFNEALRLNPQQAESYYGRGNAYFQTGDYERAIKDYSQAITMKPQYTNAYFNRGMARYHQDDFAGAIDDYTQVLKFQPKDADAYYQRALSYYDLKDYTAAVQDYDQVLKMQPDNVAAYNARGLAKSAQGDQKGGLADYTEAIRLDNKNVDGYYSRGRSRFYMGDYQGALDDYNQLLKIDPQYIDAYTNRCSTYLNLAKYENAINDCDQAIKLNPQDAIAFNNRCIAYYNLKNYSQAIADCGEAIKLQPQNSQSFSNRGLAYNISGDKDAAISDYSQAISINPNDAVAYTNRAKIYFDQGKNDQAIADYVQALRISPNYAGAYYGRALVRENLGDISGAIEDLEKAGKLSLEQGRSGGYRDAQYQIKRLQEKKK